MVADRLLVAGMRKWKPGDLIGFREMGAISRHLKSSPVFTGTDGLIVTQTDVMTVIGMLPVDPSSIYDDRWLIVLCRDWVGYAWTSWVKWLV